STSMARSMARHRSSTSNCHPASTACARFHPRDPHAISRSTSRRERPRRCGASSGKLAPMRSCRWGQVAIAAALLTTVAKTAHADALADARQAVESSDYLNAKPALEAALEAGTANPADLAATYRLTGSVEAARGDEDAAEKAFARWLVLDPKGSLPPGTSPKIMRPFTAAHELLAKKLPLSVKAETSDDPPSVTLIVTSD